VSLETSGARTGRRRSIPVVLADYDGERYIVSMLGERSPWVRNIRAAGGAAVIRHGRRQSVHLAELPPAARAPVLKAYLARAVDARPHFSVAWDAPVDAFEQIAPEYPVFRVEDD
jgi:deazaflavin-dependent oxidoreductase (nitroreductase family)